MKLIVCVDKNNGIMFNNRRISRDSKIIEDIGIILNNKKLVCSKYSSELFNNTNINIEINDNAVKYEEDVYYFLEDKVINMENITEIIIYNWNRNYPSDKKLSIDLDSYILVSNDEFIGTSHDIITKKIYKKVDVVGWK